MGNRYYGSQSHISQTHSIRSADGPHEEEKTNAEKQSNEMHRRQETEWEMQD